jgi:hypothetical protein
MEDIDCAHEYFKEVGTKSIIYNTDNVFPKTKPGFEYVPIPNNGGFCIILHL